MADQINSLEELGAVADGVVADAPAAAAEVQITREPVRDGNEHILCTSRVADDFGAAILSCRRYWSVRRCRDCQRRWFVWSSWCSEARCI